MGDLPRRGVLQGAAAVAALSSSAFAAETPRPYRVGVIGVGWFGKLDLFSMMQIAPIEVVALADVDRNMVAEAADKVMQRTDSVRRPTHRPATYHDYRDMLARHHFDIVIVATPDHWHALPTIAAINAGAHVYMEKPVTVDMREGEAVIAAARAKNRVVQVATQRRTSPFVQDAKTRVIDPGLLGKVGHVEVFCYYHQRPAHFSPPSQPPENLDWDFYCGPAPLIPFRREMHIRDWRAFFEFGNGYMGDVGVHMIDTARYLLALDWPKRVSSDGGIFIDKLSASNVPDVQSATLEFDDLVMTWTNRQWGSMPDDDEQWGVALYGEKGQLRIYNKGYQFIPLQGERIASRLPDETDRYPLDATWWLNWEQPLAALTRHHMRDFLDAVDAGRRPTADIEEGHKSTACCILANTAMKLGRTLNWDGQHVVGDAEADAALARAYRAPWTHPSAT